MAGLFSNQILLRGVGFGVGFLEVQVRLVVRIFGALRAGEQTFNRQPLSASAFP